MGVDALTVFADDEDNVAARIATQKHRNSQAWVEEAGDLLMVLSVVTYHTHTLFLAQTAKGTNDQCTAHVAACACCLHAASRPDHTSGWHPSVKCARSDRSLLSKQWLRTCVRGH